MALLFACYIQPEFFAINKQRSIHSCNFQGKVEAFIDQACSLVPSNLKEQCDQLVATFTPEVLDLLLEIKPDQWCSAIQVCQAKNALGKLLLEAHIGSKI